MRIIRTNLRYDLVKRMCPTVSLIDFNPALHSPRAPSRHYGVPSITGF